MHCAMNKWFREIESLFRNGVSPESRLFASRYAKRAGQFINRTMKGFDKEAEETREMASSFYRLLEHKLRLNERSEPPSKEEVKAAIEQLKDVGKISIFVTAVIFPGGVISLVGLELLARKYGINFSFIPSAFRKTGKEQETDPETGREKASGSPKALEPGSNKTYPSGSTRTRMTGPRKSQHPGSPKTSEPGPRKPPDPDSRESPDDPS